MRFKYTSGGLTFEFNGQMWEHKLNFSNNTITTTTTTTVMRFCFFPHWSWKLVYCAVLFYWFYVRLSCNLLVDWWNLDIWCDIGAFSLVWFCWSWFIQCEVHLWMTILYITYCCKCFSRFMQSLFKISILLTTYTFLCYIVLHIQIFTVEGMVVHVVNFSSLTFIIFMPCMVM